MKNNIIKFPSAKRKSSNAPKQNDDNNYTRAGIYSENHVKPFIASNIHKIGKWGYFIECPVTYR